MPISKPSGRAIPAARRLAVLDEWTGNWVATKEGKIIAVSETSEGLAHKLKELGSRAEGSATEYVRPDRDHTYAVGAG